jgi:hypothetical protein
MAAAACTRSGQLLAATEGYPTEFSCRSLMEQMDSELADGATSWSMRTELTSGAVQISASRIEDAPSAAGAVVLVHDLRYVARREATTRNILIIAFFVLAFGASVVTLLAKQLAWRRWTTEPSSRAPHAT